MTATAATGGLAGWAERSAVRRAERLTVGGPVPGLAFHLSQADRDPFSIR